ncbi:MAG: hypothetical protein K8H88_26355 [Sandaracinaceae bacterium]|nr:hypothetical protein [Sandaracinaceae bacterium]
MKRSALAIVLAMLMSACAGATGTLAVQLDAEESITDGLEAGTGLENIVDGWTVRFTRYQLAIGDVRIGRSESGAEARDETVHVVDLTALPATGVVIGTLEAVPAGRWGQLGYATPAASASAVRADNVPQADFDAMVAGRHTYFVEGTLSHPSGQSCPPGGTCRSATEVAFAFGVPVATRFTDCEPEEGLAGVSIQGGGTTTVSATIHGDHLFFDTFALGAEIVERRAQWLANADTDGDGRVTRAELEALDAADLFPTGTYNLAGAPIPIETAWDFVRAQLATQGHVQGEGECSWSLIDP